MRWKGLRTTCVALLFGLSVFAYWGCSSSQQEGVEEAVDQEQADGEYAEGDEYQGEGDEYQGEEGGNEYAEGGDNYGAEEGNYAEGNYAEGNYAEGYAEGNYGEELGENVLEGNQTTSDLEEIINTENQMAGVEGNETFANAMPEEAPVEEAVPAVDPDSYGEAAPMTETVSTEPAPAPAPMPAVAGALPEMGSKMPYIVRVGDTLSKIAQKIYGSSEMYQEIVELTSLRNANMVRPGDVVYYRLSEQTLAFATAYEGTPRQEITVQQGDSLSKIAARVYGSSNDWAFIWRQNDIGNPDKLEVGQKIVYLSQESFAQALDYAKSMTIAKLLEMNFGTAPSTTVASSSQDQAPVTGFEIAQGMFSTIVDQFSSQG